MGGTVIKAGAVVKHCIVAENVKVEEGATVGATPEGSLNIEATRRRCRGRFQGVVIGEGCYRRPQGNGFQMM